MTRILSFAEVEEGMQLPTLERSIDRLQLIKFAAAVDDYSQPHWDHLYMVENGFSGVIVHGWLTFSVMCQAVSAWISPELVDFKGFSVRYLKPNLPGVARYGGRVARKSEHESERRLELEIWADSHSGTRLAAGHVLLSFPGPR
jgi:acyl dehydratase